MSSTEKYRNVILCEDIREETGNKKSLMGVLAGDIMVASFPATISLAIYFEYVPAPGERDRFVAEFRMWQGETQVVQGTVSAPVEPGKIVTLVLPRGLMAVEKETTFRLTVAQNGGNEVELMQKRIFEG